jgi:hypothetical protein
MKNYFTWIVVLGLLKLGLLDRGLLDLRAMTQQAPRAEIAGQGGQAALLENGSLIYVELAKTLDARKAKAGDPVTAILLADVLSHGKIVLRKESKVIGHISEAQPYSKENPESRLGIVFDRVVAKGGHEVAFSSVLLALRPAPQIQIDSSIAPATPSRTTSTPNDPHNPAPIGGNAPRPRPSLRSDMDSSSRQISDARSTDIDGLSLVPAADGTNKIVISTRQTVKLESGVRMDLRVTGSEPKSLPQIHGDER